MRYCLRADYYCFSVGALGLVNEKKTKTEAYLISTSAGL